MENNELMITSLLFKKMLKNILKYNEGMVITVDDKMKPIYPGVDKVLIYKDENADDIRIIDYDGDLLNGEFIDIEFTD